MAFFEMLRRNEKIHLRWVIGVLAALTIVLISVDLGTNEDVKDILSFAVSFASLVLAVIAIIQALASGSALSDAIANVNRVADELRQPARDILSASNQLSERSQRIESQASELSAFMSTMASSSYRSDEPSPSGETETPDAPGKSFLEKLPLGGVASAYLARRAFDSGVEVDVREAFTSAGNAGFAGGFITALITTGTIGGTREGARFRITDPGILPPAGDYKLKKGRTEIDSYLARLTTADSE